MLFLDGIYTEDEYGKPCRDERTRPNRNGTTHVIFEPLDFIAKLAALVPKPYQSLTKPRYEMNETAHRGKKVW